MYNNRYLDSNLFTNTVPSHIGMLTSLQLL